MTFPKIKFTNIVSSFLLFFLTFMLSFGGQAMAAIPIQATQQNGSVQIPVQWTPDATSHPQLNPPSNRPSSQDSREGQRNVKPSGLIFIEVDPPDATVFMDGNKLEPSKDNTYEEEVIPGMHKVVVKKSGYQDYLEIITVSTGVTQRLTIRLKQMK